MKGKLLVGTSPISKISFVLNEIRGDRILDIGCGAGIYGYIIRNKWQDTSPGSVQFQKFDKRDLTNDEPKLLIGCDIHLENLRRCRKHNIYDRLFAANAAYLPFPQNYVDTIICIEVLEHMDKKDAYKAIENFKKIATKKIIITVPKDAINRKTLKDERKFINLNTSDEDIKSWIEAERHKSNFSLRELKNLGFIVGVTIDEKNWFRRQLKKSRRFYNNYFGNNVDQILCTIQLNKIDNTPKGEVNNPLKITDDFPDYR